MSVCVLQEWSLFQITGYSLVIYKRATFICACCNSSPFDFIWTLLDFNLEVFISVAEEAKELHKIASIISTY